VDLRKAANQATGIPIGDTTVLDNAERVLSSGLSEVGEGGGRSGRRDDEAFGVTNMDVVAGPKVGGRIQDGGHGEGSVRIEVGSGMSYGPG